MSKLSPRWLDAAAHFLRERGPSFNASWGGVLAAFETRFTSGEGAALATFSVNGTLVSSHLYLSGRQESAEAELTRLFVDSLRRTPLVQAFATRPDPFEEVFRLHERPLDAAVLWAPTNVGDNEQQMAGELSNHFAGAYFLQF